MKILVGNNHLAKTGGTENYTYTLALELKKQGHDVEYFTFEKGEISSLLEDNGVPYMSSNHYDLILANHNTVVEKLWDCGYIIQTCHGYIPALEQPSSFADAHVSVSEEVRDHLKSLGFKSIVIPNGIDCVRFSPKTPLSQRLTTVLSLCQSDVANDFIRKCCEIMNVKFLRSNKHTDNVWKVEELINQSDLVIGLGRSAYDAMACGRPVLVYDYRDYMGEFLGDGMLTSENIRQSMYCNCSGRASRIRYDEQSFIEEMQKYSSDLGAWSREFALKNLNIQVAVQKYMDICNGIDYKREFQVCKFRLHKMIDENDMKEKALLCEKEQMKGQLADIQCQLNDLQVFSSAKGRKHLRAIRVLLWLCIVLIILLVVLALNI